jgi:predicted RNA-binding Zn-ribbon protein involved in translation (DUF1610 family)
MKDLVIQNLMELEVKYHKFASCDKCGWEGNPAECKIEKEQETPEMPFYEVAICPQCGDDNIMFHNVENEEE